MDGNYDKNDGDDGAMDDYDNDASVDGDGAMDDNKDDNDGGNCNGRWH